MNIQANNRFSLAGWLRYHFITRKLNSVVGYLFIALLGVGVAYISANFSYKLAFVAVAGFIGLLLAVATVLYPYFGFYWCIVLSTLIFSPERMFNLPFAYGLVVEMYTYLTVLGVLTQQYAKQQVHREFWRHPITIMLIILFLYYTAQVANPSMFSKLGWFNYWRKYISFVAFFLVAYSLMNTKKHVRFFVKFWIIFATVLALYTIKQHVLGFAGWELNWVMADKDRYDLFFQQGFIRKFSILADPASAGAFFAAFAVFILIIALRTHEKKHKYWLYFFAILNVLAFSFTGTRTSNLMMIAGIFFYCVVTIFEKKTKQFLVASVVGFILLMTIPIYNPVIVRIRSTFAGSKDPSAALRDFNRNRIQPYMYSHPFGGGIHTSLVEGPIYNPGHPLSNFSPDSGYMKIAVEQGPIGLALACIFYYLILRTGIRNFFRTRDPEMRMWYVSILCMIFSLLAGQFSQIVIGQYPTIFFYYPALVILIKLVEFENTQPENKNLIGQQ
ncbi:MAG TPA: O-antigen ligase family protein [Chitinophagaceae bacterium]|nr:O-antigen ligase family protein [Chitinophagaceae bacterium]